MFEVIKSRGYHRPLRSILVFLPPSSQDKMIIFPVFSTAVFCLWALLLASAPTYTSILIIPILVSPVLTPLLSPADGPTILILSDVCVGTVAITLPTCNPVDAPVPINPSGMLPNPSPSSQTAT